MARVFRLFVNVAAVIAILLEGSAKGDFLTYDNTTSPTGLLSLTGSVLVRFDDIPFALSAINNPLVDSISVTRVVAGIRRANGAPAVNVSLWTAGFTSDFQLDSATLISRSTLGLNAYSGSSGTTQEVAFEFQPGVVTVPLRFAGDFAFMAVGIQFHHESEESFGRNSFASSHNSSIPGWGDGSWATGLGAPNLNYWWSYNTSDDTQYRSDGPFFNFPFTSHLRVEGNGVQSVPEPGALGLLLATAVGSVFTRRRSRTNSDR